MRLAFCISLFLTTTLLVAEEDEELIENRVVETADGIKIHCLQKGCGRPKNLPFLVSVRKERTTFADRFVRGLFKKPQSETYLKNLSAASLRTPTDIAML
jgi:hypothetical protein